MNRVDLADFGFAADLRVELGFESGSGVVTCGCSRGLDSGGANRFVGEGSEPKLPSSSEDASRVDDFLPFGFVFALGLGRDLTGDNEGDLTLFVVPLLIGVPSTLDEVEPPAITSPSSSEDLSSTGLAFLPSPRLEPFEPPRSGGLSFEDLVLGLPFFGDVSVSRRVLGCDGVTGSGSVGDGADSEAMRVGVTVVGGLVSIRTNGVGLLDIGVEPFFLTILGSGATGFGFVVTLAGGCGRSSSVSASLRDRSIINAEPGLPAKTEGARGCGGGNSRSISSRLSSIVLREVKASGCRLGVGDPKLSWPLQGMRGVREDGGEEGRENEEDGPGDDEGGGGEGIEAGTSGLGVR